MRQYGWKPTHISMALLTITIPAVFNPIIGGLTSRQGPRWWTVGGFVLCGAALLSFGSVRGHTDESKTSFVIHAAVIGIALAALINSNQVAITIASQRYEAALEAAEREGAELGLVSSLLTPGRMLSGVTTSWSAGVLVGPAYSSLIAYTEDEGWETLCRGLGGLCLVAAVGSVFLWRKW
jgi:MFS family permease